MPTLAEVRADQAGAAELALEAVAETAGRVFTGTPAEIESAATTYAKSLSGPELQWVIKGVAPEKVPPKGAGATAKARQALVELALDTGAQHELIWSARKLKYEAYPNKRVPLSDQVCDCIKTADRARVPLCVCVCVH